jgi:hypothetical protein
MSEPTAKTDASQPPAIDWSRAAEGIQMAGFGSFLFLNTTGVLPWSFWLDAVVYWPVLLVVAGLRMVVDRSRAPWLVLLGPVVILGTLGWVAWGSRPEVPPAHWTRQSARRGEGVTHWILQTSGAGTRLDLKARPLDPGLLAEGRSASRDDRARLQLQEDGQAATVRLGVRWHGVVLAVPGPRDRWELSVTDALPMALAVDGAMIRGAADLERGRLTSARVGGVFIALDLRLPRPAETVDLRMGGVFNALHITVPPGTPVRVRTDGGPFNVVHRESAATGEGPGYDVKIDGIFNNVTTDQTEAEPKSESPRPPAEAPPPSPKPS